MGIVDDVASGADWIAAALSSSGYQADFMPPSLWEVDRFFDEHAPGGIPSKRGLLSEQLGPRIFALGSYTGEVIRRHMGGEWVGDDDDVEAEINVALRIAEDHYIWPVQRAMKRFANGPEDGIGVYGAFLGLPVGPRPLPPERRKPFWRR